MIQADARHIPLTDESVHCVVTSPPYWGLRDYGIAPSIWGGRESWCNHLWGDEIISSSNDSNRGTMEWTTGGNPAAKVKGEKSSQGSFCQLCHAWRGVLGLEPTPELYVQHMVEVFREIRRVMRSDAICWCNLGDSFVDKQLQGIPWRVAFALQADGWWLRSDIIWSKPNPMPESVTDRPTKAHEYIFLLSKSADYFYDAEAIREPQCESTMNHAPRLSRTLKGEDEIGVKPTFGAVNIIPGGRNKRSVWTVATQPYPEAHFATFPEDLIKPCILAGTPVGGIILDPFAGSGTTVKVSQDLGRVGIGLDLKPEYLKMAKRRAAQGGLMV